MRGADYQARWNVVRPQYGEYLPNYQRKEVGSSSNHARVTRIPIRPPDNQEVQPTLRKMPSSNDGKGLMNTVQQSKIISALKSELSNLKYEVTKLISNDKDFSTAHNSVQSSDSLNGKSSTLTVDSHEYSKQHQYVNPNTCTIQRKPSFPNESEAKTTRTNELAATQRQVYSDPQLKDDLKSSQLREKRLIEERDDLARTLQEKSKELDIVKQSNDTRSSKIIQNKEASERQLNNIIENLKRQHGETEQYYKKRINELENGIKELENNIISKDTELVTVRKDLLQSRAVKKEDSRQTKIIESLHETNRSLTNQVLQLQQKLRQEQQNIVSCEQARNFEESEKRRFSSQTAQLRDHYNRLTQQISKTREDRDEKLKEKIRQIEQMSLEKNKLAAAKDQIQRQLDKLKETSKSDQMKGSFIMIGQHNTQSLMEQTRKQELDSLITKIQTLKKDKRALEHDIKGLIDTKEAVQRSLNSLPQNKTVDELRNELSQKEQIVNNLLADVKGLQVEVNKNRLLAQKLKANEAVLRELNEFTMKSGLANLNKRYL